MVILYHWMRSYSIIQWMTMDWTRRRNREREQSRIVFNSQNRIRSMSTHRRRQKLRMLRWRRWFRQCPMPTIISKTKEVKKVRSQATQSKMKMTTQCQRKWNNEYNRKKKRMQSIKRRLFFLETTTWCRAARNEWWSESKIYVNETNERKRRNKNCPEMKRDFSLCIEQDKPQEDVEK